MDKVYFSLTKKWLQKAAIALCALGAPIVGKAQCFSSWQYSMPVYITNPNATDLDSFQVAFYVNTAALVTAGHMNASGNDIRFVTLGNCCDSLPYHIDSGMNSTATKIWVKLPHLAASGHDTLTMLYGNASAAAGSNPEAVYDFWEDYSGATSKFTNPCNDGSGTETISGGTGTYSWSSDAVWISDTLFSLNHVYTADMQVNSISGAWPGLYWEPDDGVNLHYSLLYGYSQIRIAVSGNSTGFCQGENWASGLYNATGLGYWSFTWVATGDERSIAADYGPLNSTDATWPKTGPLRLCVGGISGSTGSYTIDWVRARKFAEIMPATTFGAEQQGATISFTTPACKGPGAADTATITGVTGGTFTIAPAGATIGSTSGIINLATAAVGTYTVTYTYTGGSCSGIGVATAVVTIDAAPIPTVTLTGNVLNAGGPYTSYQWFKNGTAITGATNATYTATTGGTYYCVITDPTGCHAQSNNVVYHPVDVKNVPSFVENITAYPNPNSGIFTINGAAKADNNIATIEIADITGRVLIKDNAVIINNMIHKEMQLSGKIPAGIYMLRVSAGADRKTVRLEIR